LEIIWIIIQRFSIDALLQDCSSLLCVTRVCVRGLRQADLIEGAHGGEHGTTNPRCILSIEVGVHVNVSILGRVICDVSDLLVKTFRESLHESGTSS